MSLFCFISYYIGPGGLYGNAQEPNCTGGAAGTIDRLLLTERHMYQHAHIRHVYGTTQAFDPEGLFGSLLTIVHCFVGVQAGVTLLVHREAGARLRRFAISAAVLGLSGGWLADFQRGGGFIPVNKSLWSLSFVLVTSAIAYAVLAGCYWLVDVKRWWSGAPFRWAGMNAIVLYVGHMVMHQMLPFRWRVGPMNGHLVLLLENGWNAAAWLAVAWWMDRRGWFVTI